MGKIHKTQKGMKECKTAANKCDKAKARRLKKRSTEIKQKKKDISCIMDGKAEDDDDNPWKTSRKTLI
ncbi:CLUMA_CG019905, isoform A [Clunio marinus]|uniref:CLUMA_CG019905, isoform A n=1 Tax=Clunio marinus TaxID=568069 RepID=A0A1J1J6H3_9DIPT|nr:CLUMA_CG019905, isoform A [Clunio marinus]